jgi:hypothetical protein
MTTRAALSEILSFDASAPTKTFVIEAHANGDPAQLLRDVAGPGNLVATEDAYLFRLLVEGAADCFWVDQLNERFWTFHTNMPMVLADRYLRQSVSARRDLDWMWLPSAHLRTVWPNTPTRGVRSKFQGSQLLGQSVAFDDVRLKLRGNSADEFLNYLYKNPYIRAAVPFDGVEVALDDPEFGQINEAVDRMGRFAVSGDSLGFHLQFVEAVIGRYLRLVELCEQKALGWTGFDRGIVESGGQMMGAPIVIRFSRTIQDLEQFVDTLFSSREPFRLWGVPRMQDGVVELEAVDLHVGQPLRIDVGEQWLRLYLTKGDCCGNSVARLASNLQHRFDAALTFVDPDLQAALEGIAPDIAA